MATPETGKSGPLAGIINSLAQSIVIEPDRMSRATSASDVVMNVKESSTPTGSPTLGAVAEGLEDEEGSGPEAGEGRERGLSRDESMASLSESMLEMSVEEQIEARKQKRKKQVNEPHWHDPPQNSDIGGTGKVKCLRIMKGKQGLGLTVQGARPSYFSQVDDDGPAYLAGARVGDKILLIQGEPVLMFGHAQLVTMLGSQPSGIVEVHVMTAYDYVPYPMESTVLTVSQADKLDEFGFDKTIPLEHMGLLNQFGTEAIKDKVGEDKSLHAPAPSGTLAEHVGLAPSERLLAEWRIFMERANKITNSQIYYPDVSAITPDTDFYAFPEVILPHNDDTSGKLMRGVPHCYRRQIWLRASTACKLRSRCRLRYDEIVKAAMYFLHDTEISLQIEKDLLRTCPTNIFFEHLGSEGTRRLERILFATGWYQPSVGYCQGMGMLASILILVLEEADAFWTLQALLTKLVPDDYYSMSMMGAIVDQRVLRSLVEENLPEVHRVLDHFNIELSLITINWFLTAFSSVCPIDTVLRIWDCYMKDGCNFLFKVALAMLTLREKLLVSLEDGSDVFFALSETPATMTDPESLLKLSYSFMHIDPQIQPKRELYHREVAAEKEAIARRRAEREGTGSGDEGDRDSTKEKEREKDKKKNVGITWNSAWKGLVDLGVGMGVGMGMMSKPKRPVAVADVTKKLESLTDVVTDIVLVFESLLELTLHTKNLDADRQKQLYTESAGRIGDGSAKDPGTSAGHAHGHVAEGEDADKREHLERRVAHVVGDEKVYPGLTNLVHTRLSGILLDIISEGFSASFSPWMFIEAVSKLNLTETKSSFSLLQGKQLDVQENATVLVGIRGAVETADGLYRFATSQHEQNKFNVFMSIALNARALHLWFDVLSRAAASPQFSVWFHPNAILRNPTACTSILKELCLLSKLRFRLQIE